MSDAKPTDRERAAERRRARAALITRRRWRALARARKMIARGHRL